MTGSEPDIRVLYDNETELLVLGTVLQSSNECYESIAGILRPEHFGSRVHQALWSAIEHVASEVLIGTDSVFQHLTEKGEAERVGGLIGLLDIHSHGIPGLRLEGYARTLAGKARRRRQLALIELLSKSVESGQEPSRDVLDELTGLAPQSGELSIAQIPAVSAEASAISFVIDPILPEGAVIALTGESGCGKSSVATALMRDAIAMGRPCLMLDRENPRPVVLDRMNRLRLHDGPLLRWAGGWLEQDAPGPDSPIVHEWARACNPKPLIVIDSLSAFMAADENSATEMRAFMQGPRRLADLGAVVLLIHHGGKAETSRDFRGSSDFKASLDQAFHVTNISSDQHLDRLRLRPFKSRYGLMEEIVYRYANGAMLRDCGRDSAARTQSEQLTELLRANPYIGKSAFEDLAMKNNLGRNRARMFIEDGVDGGLIDYQDGGRNQFKYFLVEGSK